MQAPVFLLEMQCFKKYFVLLNINNYACKPGYLTSISVYTYVELIHYMRHT